MPAADLLEREGELATLDQAVDAALQGDGQAVAIIGDPGVGKTRLLQAATAEAKEAGFEILTAKGVELEHDLSWGLAREALEPALSRRPGGESAELFAGRAQLAKSLFDGGGDMLRSAPPQQLVALAASLTALTLRLPKDRPVALLIDDAHWGDLESLRWLNHVAQRIGRGIPVLMVVAFRRDEPCGPADEVAGLLVGASARLPLSPLSVSGTAALVGAEVAHPAAISALHQATGGNPFMIGQLLRNLDPATVTVETIARASSEQLRALVLPRIARLGGAAKRLSEAVAILAGDVDLTTATRLAQLSEQSAVVAIDRLVQAGIFADAMPLSFAHPLLHSVVLDSLTAVRADRQHRDAARLLAGSGADPRKAAAHLTRATPVGDPWARELLVLAGDVSMYQGDPKSAAALFSRALLEPRDQRWPVLLLKQGRAELQAGAATALETLRRAFESAHEPRSQAQAALEVGDALMAMDRPGEAVDFYSAGADAIDDREGQLRLHLLAQGALGALAVTEDPERAIAAIGASSAAVERWPEFAQRSALVVPAVVAVWSGQPAQACAGLLEQALTASPYEDRLRLEWGPDLAWLMAALSWCDAYERRDVMLDSLIERARGRGAVSDLALAVPHRAYGLIRRGRVLEALRDVDTAATLCADMEAGPNPMAIGVALDAQVALGDLESAEKLLAESDIPPSDHSVVFLSLLDARGRLRLAQGRLQEAREDLDAVCEEIARHGFSCPGAVRAKTQLALVMHASGQVEESRELLGDELAAARAFGAPRALGLALTAAGRVLAPDAALDALSEAVDVLAESAARLEHAGALLELGKLLRRRGERRAAVSALREALDAAVSCCATGLTADAKAELYLAGARPRRERVTGPLSLTEGERRVASLAAAGLANPEIARRLYVTRRTVETHLTSVYRKLDIRGRDELEHALRDGSSADAS